MTIPNLEAAARMRDLPTLARDAAIGAADNVLDLRPALREKAKQRQLARQMRAPRKPGGRA